MLRQRGEGDKMKLAYAVVVARMSVLFAVVFCTRR
jgi:hypothetical protein